MVYYFYKKQLVIGKTLLEGLGRYSIVKMCTISILASWNVGSKFSCISRGSMVKRTVRGARKGVGLPPPLDR